jgi:multicomponent K+:H+ antiporter subunit A
LIGLPFTSGSFAKEALNSATSSWPVFSMFLVCSALGTSLLMGRFIQLMRQPSVQPPSLHKLCIQKTSASSPRWGLILPTAFSTLMCVSYLYLTPAFEFKTQQSMLSTMSWGALWPGLVGLIMLVVSSKLRAGIVSPAAGDILIIYQTVGRFFQQMAQKISQIISKISKDLSQYFLLTLGRSQSLLSQSSKQLVIDTPGTVMIIVLAVLFYSFIS